MPTYLDLEQARFGGRPVELYHFYQGAVDWFYTSAKFTIITLDDVVWEPIAIHRGEYEAGGDDAPGQLAVTLPVDTAFGLEIIAGTIVSPITLKIFRFHRTAEADTKIIFWGEVVGKDVEGAILTLQCQPTRGQANFVIPRGLFYRDQCIWNTYDPVTCKVDKATYTFTGTITDIDGLNVEVLGAAAFPISLGVPPDGFYNGGILQVVGLRPGLIEIGDLGTDIYTLDEFVPGLTIGATVEMTAGDDRTSFTCHTRFHNSLRRMSFPKMPLENVFYGQGLRAP